MYRITLDPSKRLPICLPDVNVPIDGAVVANAGWGVRYEVAQEGTKVSSCLTNDIGPKEYMFQHCNMSKIVEYGGKCKKDEYHKSIKDDQKQCENQQLWSKAEQKVPKKEELESKWRLTEKIDIKTRGSVGCRKCIQHTSTCYRDDVLKKYGWCDTTTGGWGYCSPSCSEEVMKVCLIIKFSLVLTSFKHICINLGASIYGMVI